MKDKFDLGEEEEEEEENLTTRQQKKPIRHHVKRRSSGRVKLVGMTRTNSNNSEVGYSLERSPSQRKRKPIMSMTRVKDIQPLTPVTAMTIAPPIEQKLNAVASHIVIPVNKIPIKKKKQLLFSRFISRDDNDIDIVNREYMCIKRYQDPMLTSLMRCTTNTTIPPPSPLNQQQRYHHLKLVARAANTIKQEPANTTTTKSFWKSFFYI